MTRRNVTKNASGYFAGPQLDAPSILLFGSEGTLGVVVEAELGAIVKPEGFFSGVVFFGDQKGLLAFVDKARDMDATLIEYFDHHSLWVRG